LCQLEWAAGQRLGLKQNNGEVDLTGTPVLLVEQAYASKADREKWAQLLFEEYNVPGVFMSRAGVLALYANARVTGVAVDLGAGGMTVTPVQEGYPLMGGLRRSPVGGKVLDRALVAASLARSCPLHPRIPGVKVAPTSTSSSSSSAAWAHGGGGSTFHPSLKQYHTLEVARDARESLCRVYESTFDADAHAHVPIVSYDLPDGTKLSLGPERYAVTELLFNPTPLQSGAEEEDFGGAVGLTDMLQDAILACEPETRRDLNTNVTLTGGLTSTEGLSERLLKELLVRTDTLGSRPKMAAASSSERAVGPWLGGSILASLGTFPDIWFSKAEYQEFGAKMLHRKVL